MGKICNNCHRENSDTAGSCMFCGNTLFENRVQESTMNIKKNHSWYHKFIIGIIILIVIIALYFAITSNWFCLILTLVFGIPIIAKMLIDILLNKAKEKVFDVVNDRYTNYQNNNNNNQNNQF